jgi:integrase
MPVLAKCPQCKTKLSVKRKLCACGKDLDKAKERGQVRYWIGYRTPTGKQRRELVGTSITEANLAYSKRTVQRVEKPSILERPKESSLTFSELTAWYLGDEPINGKTYEAMKDKAYFVTVRYNLQSFNEGLGSVVVGQVEKIDLENYQSQRRREGYSFSYIDDHMGAARTMVKVAWENNIIGGKPLKEFRKVKKLLTKNANARVRVLSLGEYQGLLDASEGHMGVVLELAFWTGMRRGEILNLTWERVDLGRRLIYLESSCTKEGQAKTIPIAKPLLRTLMRLPNRLQAASGNMGNNHVISFRGKPVKDVRGALSNACEKADIPFGRKVTNGFTLHDMRHTFATVARKAGVPRNVIIAIMGHSDSTDMNLRYDTVDESDLLEAVDRIEAYVQEKSGDVTKVLPEQPSKDIAYQ